MTQRQRVKETTERVAAIRGDSGDARRWMRQPNAWLDGATPIELLKTPGGREILNAYLARVEYDGGQGC
jgi:uncharacterized protein (DUF2384 family)